MIHVAILADRNIREKDHKNIEKYQGLNEQLEWMWKVRSSSTYYYEDPRNSQASGSTDGCGSHPWVLYWSPRINSLHIRMQEV